MGRPRIREVPFQVVGQQRPQTAENMVAGGPEKGQCGESTLKKSKCLSQITSVAWHKEDWGL